MMDRKSYLPFLLAKRKLLLFVFISTVNVLKQTFYTMNRLPL